VFLNDVLESYRAHNVAPYLEVRSVEAKLTSLRLKTGTVGKNR
jgi:hypothetical protein